MESLINFIMVWIILSKILINSLNTSASPISGGEKIQINQAKFVVQVVSPEEMCGGTLISPQLVITAAHCVYDAKIPDITVIGGATFYNRKGQRSKIVATYIPDEYSFMELYWDIAILKLHTPFKRYTADTIPLCNSHMRPGQLVTVFGWGKTHEFDQSFYPNVKNKQQQLQMVEIPILPPSTCESRIGRKLPRILFCAGVPGEKDSCAGDSGGPVVFNGELCGIVSFGGFCPDLGFYVDVSKTKEFINGVLQADKKNNG